MTISNEKYINYITPQLQEFWCKYRLDYIKSNLTNGIFLPHVFEKYDNAPLKIFYIGQDVPYWTPAKSMIECFDSNKYVDYYESSNQIMQPIKNKQAWGNSPSAFWTMVVKLQILLTTGKWKDIQDLTTRDVNQIQSLGYGNICSATTWRTLQTYHDINEISNSHYENIRVGLLSIEKLKHIVDIYEPDVIIILCRNMTSYQEDNYFADLNIKWNFNEEMEQYIITGDIREKKETKLIWCPNPNYYRFMGTNMQEMAMLIKSYIE